MAMTYLRDQETTFDPVSQWHGEVPYDQRFLRQNPTQLLKEPMKVLLVVINPMERVSTKPNADTDTQITVCKTKAEPIQFTLELVLELN